jgi:hypothetical protein
MLDHDDFKLQNRKAAEALLPVLSHFHELGNEHLKAVYIRDDEGSVDQVLLVFDGKVLRVTADADWDTIEFCVSSLDSDDLTNSNDRTQSLPRSSFVSQPFGCGWVTLNQQGYCDGILISFGGVVPMLSLNVAASSVRVSALAPVGSGA